jgi:hypothetical protein
MHKRLTHPCRILRVDQEFKEQRALLHFNAARETRAYAAIIPLLMHRFGYTEADVQREFLRYNLHINEETNGTYQLIGTQFALLINYLVPGSWFSRRLERYTSFVQDFRCIADVGFGLPFPWLLAALGGPRLRGLFQFVDSSQSALDFAHELIQVVEKGGLMEPGHAHYSLQLGSIEHSSQWQLQRPEAVVALDCIEHAPQARQALSDLARKLAGSTFLIGLPVGTPIPQHTIDFDSKEDAITFVATAGLRVRRSYLVRPEWERDVVGNPGFQGSVFVEAV